MSTTTTAAAPSDAAQFEAHVAKHLLALVAEEGHRPGLPEDEDRLRKGGRPVTDEVEQRRRHVVDLVRKGMPTWQIANKLGYGFEAIKADRKVLKREGLI